VFLALITPALPIGCSEEPDPPHQKWVLVDTDSLTGFYVGKTEGGLLTIRLDDYDYLARRPPTTPPLVPPTEVYGTLYPDHADTMIQLTGTRYGSFGTTYFTLRSSDEYSGSGYVFSGTYSELNGSFGGAFASQADTGYFGGYVGSMDSVQVYCGSFAGDSLHGRWHFAVRAPGLKGAGIASDTSVVLGFTGTILGSEETGPVTLVGTANGELSLSGEGSLDAGAASGTWTLSAGFDAGTWIADRMQAVPTAALAHELVDR
jgi:hypothetical protein